MIELTLEEFSELRLPLTIYINNVYKALIQKVGRACNLYKHSLKRKKLAWAGLCQNTNKQAAENKNHGLAYAKTPTSKMLKTKIMGWLMPKHQQTEY
jgi:hypothetical protein